MFIKIEYCRFILSPKFILIKIILKKTENIKINKNSREVLKKALIYLQYPK